VGSACASRRLALHGDRVPAKLAELVSQESKE
jgi:hypothetical protein